MATQPEPFVHLQVHTEYSIVDSVVRIGPLIEKAHALGMPAVAMTDEMALFGMVKFYQAAMAKGIKPLVGAELCTDQGRLTVLCRNRSGYQRLSALLSRAYQHGQTQGKPVIPWSWLLADPSCVQDLIAFANPMDGILQGVTGTAAAATQAEWAQRLHRLFPDAFYVELRRLASHPDQISHAAWELENQVWDWADTYDFPVVATCGVRFLEPHDFEAHETRVCIGAGEKLADPQRVQRYHPEQYFKSAADLAQLWADAPFVLTNAQEIAKRCNLEMDWDQVFLPQCPIPDGLSAAAYLRQSAEQGLAACLAEYPVADPARYHARLSHEIDVIVQMGFAAYFLIVADFIGWAKRQQIPVGPGRGSGAGSLVAYALGITGLDPIAYDLLFERFLNPERVSMPDFDIDFCMEGRDRVIQYVSETYGRDSVSQIITFGSMAAKAVVRDVGRVLDHPYGFVDKIAKLIPFELGMTLQKALQQEPLLATRYQEEEEVKSLIDLSLALEGITRNVGKHAGGVVIAPSHLTDFVPLYYEPDNPVPVSQFDKDDVEKIGLVKFDFLGLKTLTLIDWALQAIVQAYPDQPPIDLSRIPLTDPDTFALLASGDTTAIFQLESEGMQDLVKRLRPDSFEDIIALVALYRPGPLQSGMVDDFIACKHGKQAIRYPHPELEPILKPTYGVILYQEQVMQIAQVLAGYTLGQADSLRRAMGKKKPEEMQRQRAIFQQGAVDRGIDGVLAGSIFDLMEKFAGYGFNKSHSAAYALLSYQTAWLKAHYPACFMAAVLSGDMAHTDKIVHLLQACQRMGLKVEKPDVQTGDYPFTVSPEGTIRYGLGAIKGVGEAAVRHLVDIRQSGGPFRSFFDYIRRLDLKKMNKRALEALIKSGAIDSLGSRAVMIASLEKAMQWGQQQARDMASGQMDLFALTPADLPTTEKNNWTEPSWTPAAPWSFDTQLHHEKSVLGHYISGHPLDPYRDWLVHHQIPKLRSMTAMATEKPAAVRIVGLIQGMRIKKSQTGDPILFATLEDTSGHMDLGFFGEACHRYRENLQSGEVYAVEGRIRKSPFNGRVRVSVDTVYPVKRLRSQDLIQICLPCPDQGSGIEWVEPLRTLLAQYAYSHADGTANEPPCMVLLHYQKEGIQCHVDLGTAGRVRPDPQLLGDLESLFPALHTWKLVYRSR